MGGLDEVALRQSSIEPLRVCVESPGGLPHGSACCDTRDWIAPGSQGGAVHWSGSRAEVVQAVESLLDAAAEHQQARVLARVERVGHARARPPAEAIGLVVVALAVAVKRPANASQTVMLFLEAHVS